MTNTISNSSFVELSFFATIIPAVIATKWKAEMILDKKPLSQYSQCGFAHQ